MKKKLLLLTVLVFALTCIFAISVSAVTQAEADKYYYDKVYVTADGQHELPLYEKSGDTYYPLVWFAYDVLGEDGTTVVETKYVKAHFEDISVYSEAPSQGRFNGVYYEYTDENGNQIVLNSSNAVLINMRGIATKTIGSSGNQNSTNVTLLRIEWSKSGYPSFSSKLEAVYTPLSMLDISGYTPNSVRVLDYDRHHGPVTVQRGAFQNSKATVVYIPGGSTFNGNDQFKDSRVETIIFGAGTENITIQGYTFSGASSLKRVYWLSTKEQFETLTISSTNNGDFPKMTQISFTEYMLLTESEKSTGKYIIFETPECFALGHLDQAINVCVSQCTLCSEKTVKHVDNDSITVSAEFANYLLEGKKVTSCHMEGCSHVSEETLAPLFSSKGYSKDNVNANGIVIDFSINKEAIEEYESLTQKTVTFGLFVALESSLDENNGTVNLKDENVAGVVKTEMPRNYFAYMGLKLHGFDNEEKQASPFAIGAYTMIDNEISFVQLNSTDSNVPVFTTYTEIIANIKE